MYQISVFRKNPCRCPARHPGKRSGPVNIYAVAIIVLLSSGCTSPPVVNRDDTSFPACGSFPNCVSSEAEAGEQAVTPIAATEQQWQQLTQWIAQQDDWEVVEESASFIQAVVKTPLLGFRDDVLLRFEAIKQIIHVRSSSRLGYSDLGVNRDRVESLRAQITN